MLGAGAYDGILNPIIQELANAQVPAYGFVNEAKLYENNRPERTRVKLLERWLDSGLELGNHGYRHLDLHVTPVATYLVDIDRGGRVTSDLLYQRGSELEFFRHPMLHTGRSIPIRDSVTAHLTNAGMRVAPVTIDNHEWIFARAYERALVCDGPESARDVASLYLSYMDTVTGYYEAQSRAIVGYEIPQVLLLHANRLNADYLDPLLGVYRKRGYRFIQLHEALEDPAYSRPDTFTGAGGITWLHRWALTDGKRGDFFAGEPGVPTTVQALYDEAAANTQC
jgi:peptidoglycan/xylan/chitin deacetylase (PgdA/CDA1 family)